MTRLSSPVQNIKDRYQTVVVGSGYGASIAASRLARSGQSLCVLERGRELRPGEYPDTWSEAVAEVQAQLPDGHVGERSALFDFRIGHDLSVLVGCGLGGTSLINASVCLRATPEVLSQAEWPEAIRTEAAAHGLDPYYRRAEAMLGCTPYPQDAPLLRKLEAQQQSAQALGKPLVRPPLAVSFRRGVNTAGVTQAACSLCGDCVTGCNYGAKGTTLMNYLPDAHRHGAEIFTEVEVRHIERDPDGDGWRVYFDRLGPACEIFGPLRPYVRAAIVVLAAGALGSTEILLRSQRHGLSLSPRLGARFSGNADFVGFAYDCRQPVNGIGAGAHAPRGRDPVGPCVTSYIDLRDGAADRPGLIVEEGSIPGALSAIVPVALGLASDIEGQPAPASLWDRLKATLRAVQSDLFGAYSGAVQHTQTYLVMGQDRDSGQLQLVDDRLRVQWPGIAKSPLFATISQTLAQVAEPLGGTYLKEPLWNRWTREQLITVHPLGGCAMADDATQGVVNHQGQVFAGTAGEAVHPGLYVIDGSTVPVPLGVNPLLTICALAERSCERLAADHGWKIDTARLSPTVSDGVTATLGVQISEQLDGVLALSDAGAAAHAVAPGSDHGDARIAIRLTIEAADLDAVLRQPGAHATISGRVDAPQISPQPLRITAGRWQLHTHAAPRRREQRYHLPLSTEDGQSWLLIGTRRVHDEDRENLWRDQTQLHCTIYAGASEESAVFGRAVLSTPLPSFAQQLATIKALGAHAPEPRIAAIARFGCAFAGELFETYGRVVAESLPFHAGRPRKKRPLRVVPPQTHYIRSADGVLLRLLRYPAGRRGPVMLVPGLGVSSQIFATDTVDTCLVEYLAEHGYDVWLFDPRTSIALPSAGLPATADDVARYDYPAALAAVRRISAAPSVQIVGHELGGTALLMSLLSPDGLAGVRSIVLSQSAADVVAPLSRELGAGLHLPGALEELGLSSLSADPGPGWMDRLFDRVSALGPQALFEHDHNPVSRRITWLYGRQYDIQRLSALTYGHGLGELFGVASLAALEHTGTLVRAGHLVDARGRDVYMSRLGERLRLPITFLHGADNRVYLPEGSERSYQHLVQLNGSDLYARRIVPGYGHLDCILGKDAVRDVYPHILAALDAHAEASPAAT